MQDRKECTISGSNDSGTVFGIDGCRKGWICIALEPSGAIWWRVVTKLGELVDMAHDGVRMFVDIPIGLSDGPDERLCDLEARRKLGPPRGSSIFRAPARAALDAGDYEEAKRINLEVAGKKISKQTWAIMAKIREVDVLMRHSEKARNMVREVHPEVCFWALAGVQPMEHNKKKPAGIEERIAVLERVRPSVREEYARIYKAVPRREAGRDDILDAMAAAMMAYVDPAELRTLPEWPPRDSHGLPMKTVYFLLPEALYVN